MATKKLLTMIMLIASTYCYSQTQIPPGPVAGTWSDPYYQVNGDIYISAGNSLTIAANTRIEFTGSYIFSIYGTISAGGSSGNEILFTTANQAGWKGIEIPNNANSNVFEYCIVESVSKSGSPCTSSNGSGAVYLYNSSGTSFSNCTLRNNDVCYSGGGIAVYASSADIQYCYFHDNSASQDGGGLFISNSALTSNVTNCTFENNTALNGGGLYIMDCSNELLLESNTFLLNNAENGAGAYFESINFITTPTFTNNSLISNTASGNGGGLYIKTSTINKITDNIFQLNEAENGAGLYVDESEISNLQFNDFEGNNVNNNGGGVFLDKSYVYMKSCKIYTNQAQNNGGGIFIEGFHPSGFSNYLINCLVYENTANFNGGGIFTSNNYYSFNNTIANNNAILGIGGGIFHNNCTSTITNTIIWGNTAIQNNDAFPAPDGNLGYSYSCIPTVVNCPSCTTNDPDFKGNGDYSLSYNTSCFNAGNNNVQHEPLDLDNNNRIMHNVIDIGAYEDPLMHVCGQVNGNWTDHNPNGIDYVVNCNIEVPTGSTLIIQPGTEIAFDGDYKIDINGTLTASGSSGNLIKFTSTSGNTWKGIRFINNTNTSSMDYCEINNVYKPPMGSCLYLDPDFSGAIYIENSSNITISNSKIYNNEVCSYGGGICIDNCSPTIFGNEIVYNIANRVGGSIAIVSGSPSIHSNFIENNQCYTDGGGIYTSSGSTPVIYNNLIANNFANLNGGGIFMDENSITNIYNCTVADNVANGGDGGGLYHSNNSSSTLVNNIIWGNTAHYASSHHIYKNPGSSPVYSYTCSDYSISPCQNCTTNNPEFVGNGDYSIGAYTSPCFDAGNNNVTHAQYDLQDNSRIINQVIDIGAYEIYISKLCGNVSGTWKDKNKNGIDYIIDCGDVTVQYGTTLTIENGTSIVFDGVYSINVYGSLMALGNSSKNITFTPLNTVNGWGGMNFGSYTSTYAGTSKLSYCNINYVNKTQYTPQSGKEYHDEYSGAIFINATSTTDVLIEHCDISNNKVSSHGGAVACHNCPSTVEIKNSFIHNNEAKIRGGGISLTGNSSLKIENCSVYNNITYMGGGGIWINPGVASPMPNIIGNHIFFNTTYGSDNTSAQTLSDGGGGGIGTLKSNAVIEGNKIFSNESIWGAYSQSGYGGGIYCGNNSTCDIYKNEIYDNEAKFGAGIAANGSSPAIRFSYIDNNGSTSYTSIGGGIHLINSGSIFIYNNLITNNAANIDAGGMYFDNDSDPLVYSCTIADNKSSSSNSAGGVSFLNQQNNPKFRNTIIYFNTPEDVHIDGDDPDPNDASYYSYCDFGNFSPQQYISSNIFDDPIFYDRNSNDYRISYAKSTNPSPCIDAGNDNYVYYSYDIRLIENRIVDVLNNTTFDIDIGAYEYENTSPPHYKITVNDSSISVPNNDKVVVYPNPSESGVFIQIITNTDKVVTVNLIDPFGKVIDVMKWSLLEGSNQYYIKRNNLASGIYFLRIHSNSINDNVIKLILK